MMGAAIATIAAYTTMFVGMVVVVAADLPVPYQWRRVATAAGDRRRARRGREARRWRAPGRALLSLAYPLALLPLGFYLPARAERDRRRGSASRAERQATIR